MYRHTAIKYSSKSKRNKHISLSPHRPIYYRYAKRWLRMLL